MNKNLSLLQNYDKSNFFIDPFPHVIIDNALPENIYEELEKHVPNDLINQTDLAYIETPGVCIEMVFLAGSTTIIWHHSSSTTTSPSQHASVSTSKSFARASFMGTFKLNCVLDNRC